MRPLAYRSAVVHGTLLPTPACTPPHDDYDYDCDVNRGPTFNHARTGVSLLLLLPSVAFDCAGRPAGWSTDVLARCLLDLLSDRASWRRSNAQQPVIPRDRDEGQRRVRVAILTSIPTNEKKPSRRQFCSETLARSYFAVIQSHVVFCALRLDWETLRKDHF